MSPETLSGNQSAAASGETSQSRVSRESPRLRHWRDLTAKARSGEEVDFDAFKRPAAVKICEGIVLAPDRTLALSNRDSLEGLRGIFACLRGRGKLLRQVEAVNLFCEGVTGSRVDWQGGLKAHYDENKVPQDLQHSLSTPQGMTTVIEKILPQLVAAVTVAPDVARRLADGQIARTVEDVRARFDQQVEKDDQRLRELIEKNRRESEGKKIGNEKKLAQSFVKASSALVAQAGKEGEIKAAESGVNVRVFKALLEKICSLPPAMLRGFQSELIDLAREHRVAFGSAVVTAYAAGIVPLALGLFGLWAMAPIGLGIVMTGSLIEGIIKKSEKGSKKDNLPLTDQPAA